MTTKKKTSNKKTYVSIVLDQSESMGSIWDDTIGSFNAQVEAIKSASKGVETFISLTLFNSYVDVKHFAEPVDKLETLTKLTYQPNGGTAMYDAIGKTIDRMQKELSDIDDPNVSVLFVIITDGQENSSMTISGEMLGNIIKSLNKTKRWTFSVLGANIDLEALAGTLNINTSNMANFAASAVGVASANAVTTASYNRYFATRSAIDDMESASLNANFYNENNEYVIDTTKIK